jgi:hypothetical protein
VRESSAILNPAYPIRSCPPFVAQNALALLLRPISCASLGPKPIARGSLKLTGEGLPTQLKSVKKSTEMAMVFGSEQANTGRGVVVGSGSGNEEALKMLKKDAES